MAAVEPLVQLDQVAGLLLVAARQRFLALADQQRAVGYLQGPAA